MSEPKPSYVTRVTDEGRAMIIRGESILAPYPNSHNATGYIPCTFRIDVLDIDVARGAMIKLSAVDIEDNNKVLIDMGAHWVPLGGNLAAINANGDPVIGVAWPYHLD